MGILKKIDFKKPKYLFSFIIYLISMFVGYYAIDAFFYTDKAEIPDASKQTTEYLNPNLPGAQIKGDGIDSKYESMLKSYGKIEDFSAVDNINRDNDEQKKEEYDSKYSDADLALLDQNAAADAEALEQQRRMQERLQESARKGTELSQKGGQDRTEQERQQQATIDELNRALAMARLQGQQSVGKLPNDTTRTGALEGKVEINERLVQTPSDKESLQVVKKVKQGSDYFYTMTANELDGNLIKAIIDEDIKAVDGSRVRLRLLDDIEVGDLVLHKGAYLYATMSGFGSQRVKGTVKSVLMDDEIVKINLSIYDTDGLEGLYVPSSSFRETTKDVASGAMSGNMTMNNTTSGNSLAQWGMQAAQNAYQKTTNAISKSIKKNKVHLKYGTFVYLINGKETKTK